MRLDRGFSLRSEHILMNTNSFYSIHGFELVLVKSGENRAIDTMFYWKERIEVVDTLVFESRLPLSSSLIH